MSTYCIAELGSCHGNSLSVMEEMAVMAKGAGADAIKLQWVSDPVAMGKHRNKAYADGYHDHYAKFLTWPKSWHLKMAKHCVAIGIDYLCTVFLPKDIKVIEPYVSRFKVASFEATDLAFVAAHTVYQRPVYVSTGMCDGRDVRNLMAIPHVACLHCTSAYPARLSELNLHVLHTTPGLIGFSDHSDPAETWTGSVAVATGASVVEAHVRPESLDGAGNPDFLHSMTPGQFHDYIKRIRDTEAALGSGVKQAQQGERAWMEYRVTP